jgi:Rieske Fe-S protein
MQRWSGQVLEPVDSLAYIGRSPRDAEHVFIATGDSGHGLTHGAIAGMLMKDLVLGRRHPWQALYDPARKRVAFDSIKEYVRLASTISKHYAEWLKPRGNGHLRELAPGAGRVIRRGRRQLAVSRDDDGVLYACSAVCPHLGCTVHWNSHERSWDCPCHGSRFSARGELLNGPALRGLKPEPLESDLAADQGADASG